MISYWHSYRSEVSGIGGSQNDFVMARGQLHWPDPKLFFIGQVTGPRLVALARPEVGFTFTLQETRSIHEEGFTFTLQETRSIHDSMNLPKIEFIS